MAFDIRTAILGLAVGNLVLGLILLLYQFDKEHPQRIPFLATGKLLQGVGWLLLYGRGSSPDFLSFTVGNIVLIIGTAYDSWAMYRISQRPVSRTLQMASAAGIVVLCLLATPLSAAGRVAIASFTVLIFFALGGHAMLSVSSRNSLLRRHIGGSMWLMVAVTCVRGTWAALAPENFTLFSANTIQVIMFAALYYLMLTNGFGLLLLAKQIADRELRDSEARFRSYFELPVIGIAITSPDKGWLDANAKLCDMLGYTKAELMQMTWAELTHPDDITADLAQFNRVQVGEIEGYRLEKRFIHKAGHSVYIDLAVQCLRRPDRSVNYFVALLQDITERKQAEQSLARRASQLAIINEIGRQITAARAVDDVLDQATHLMCERLGVQHVGIFVLDDVHAELVLRSRAGDFAHLFAADHRLKIGQGIVGWVAGHGQRLLANDVQMEARYVNVYGEALPTRSELAVPIIIAGQVRGVLDVQSTHVNAFEQNDVLAQETLADQIAVALENARLYEQIQQHAQQLAQRVAARTAELQAANVRLTELDHLKDEFLARTSHELRTPLTGILLSLELLESSQPDKRERYMQRLKHATQRLREIIEDVLLFSRLNLDLDPALFVAAHLNDLIDGQVAAWQTVCAAHNLAFQLDLAHDLPRVRVPGELLTHAVIRLVTNAVNYTPAGAVTISTARVIEVDRAWTTLSVKDTGPGITAEDLPHIFERFYRGRAAANYKTPGTGIGLSISREIAEKLGGRLTVETEVGVGSTFTLWLPASPVAG